MKLKFHGMFVVRYSFYIYGNVCVCARAGVSLGLYAVTFDTLSEQFKCCVQSIFKQ